MYDNQRGFTVMEALLSFSLILFLTASAFPVLFHLLHLLKNSELEFNSHRLLYESLEKVLLQNSSIEKTVTEDGHPYHVILNETEKGVWMACVDYKNTENKRKQYCLEEVEPQ
ncbi:hypothetical protein [Falsibacillus albus]|uniref:hypothetical protein n=1 Tax=Falsibacillus albus TaxID=2478915 RepID=UPI0011E5F957|nr:hypothetical protein [Falsibacillus albus]